MMLIKGSDDKKMCKKIRGYQNVEKQTEWASGCQRCDQFAFTTDSGCVR